MRQFRETQLSLVPSWGPHQHTRELQMAGRILDERPEIGELVRQDLLRDRRSDTGRPGLSGDQVVRIAPLKLIPAVVLELPLDAIRSGRHVGHFSVARPTRDPLQACSAHQPRDCFSSHRDSVTQRQLGMHSSHSVCPARPVVNDAIRSISQMWRSALAERG